MSYGIRLRHFIKSSYGSIPRYSELIGISEDDLRGMVSELEPPSFAILNKLFDSGLSINWLIRGAGEMFAPNAEGRKLTLFSSGDSIEDLISKNDVVISEQEKELLTVILGASRKLDTLAKNNDSFQDYESDELRPLIPEGKFF